MVKVDLSELKVEGKEVIDKLVEFIKDKTGGNPEISSNLMTLEDDKCSKGYMRVLLRKFLYKIGLKPYYRVISGEENTLIIKERRSSEQ
ncbi:hypothetical protein H5T51_07895 [Candidatus Bathyarchaeota archaeon]|nr:hypothetical protein [Candidatus Bathyarchaeota archaeon]